MSGDAGDRILLYEVRESNMAGYHWITRVHLAPTEGDPLRLEVHTESVGDDEEPWTTEVRGLDSALDLVRGIALALEEHGHGWTEPDLDVLAVRLESAAPEVAADLRAGAGRLMEIEDQEAARAAARRAEVLAPFRDRIRAYAAPFSTEKLRVPGWGPGPVYPPLRYWVTVFLEDYVVEHGRLPTGRHRLQARRNGVGYAGAMHDFGELGEEEVE